MKKRLQKIFAGLLVLDLCVLGIVITKYYKEYIPEELTWQGESLEEMELPPFCSVQTKRSVVDAMQTKTTSTNVPVKLFNLFTIKHIKLKWGTGTTVAPVGEPIGIYVETKGLLVLDVAKVEGKDGLSYAPGYNRFKTGHYILRWNDVKINTIAALNQQIQKTKGKKVPVTIRRNKEEMKVAVTPVMAEDGTYKIGTWVREDTQGIGTMTYITENGRFGTLGHGITDMDTGTLLNLKGGEVYQGEILGITKGKKGEPGELQGYMKMSSDHILGIVSKNTEKGVFGTIQETWLKKYKNKQIPLAYRQNIKKGKAYVGINLTGAWEKYEIEIEKIHINSHDNKGMEICVTDKRLLKLTGGIVQGMSGAPILQNGKMVGAITHVFVEDPTRGYGIFIEEMQG
mgnify:FL=1